MKGEYMRHFYPDRRCISVLRAVILSIGLVIFAVIRYYVRSEKAVFISGAIIAGICFAVMFVYLPLYFSTLKYTATDKEIIRSSGVFIRLNQSVSYSSIQYTTVINTIFSRFTGLNFMIFFVFGGRFRLMFLSSEDMEDILRLSGSSGKGGGRSVS